MDRLTRVERVLNPERVLHVEKQPHVTSVDRATHAGKGSHLGRAMHAVTAVQVRTPQAKRLCKKNGALNENRVAQKDRGTRVGGVRQVSRFSRARQSVLFQRTTCADRACRGPLV